MSLTFGEKIKEARKSQYLTQKQLAELIGAAHNSISDWENNKNKPDPDTIELLCGALKITPNYLLKSSEDDFSPIEKKMIKKYRDLDIHGKEMVDFTLNKEWERSIAESNNKDKCIPIISNDNMNYVNAAHADDYSNASDELKQQEEDIMDEDNF